MGTARQDYMRFLHWLHAPEQHAPENVRRFANMILADFDAVAATARQRNSRSAHIARLARRTLAQTSPEPPQVEAPNAANVFPWRRLRNLTVGPFRGFRREETFDFQKRIVLVYGPNGSGKTSLCEALERALLGSVEEAELKRIDEARYLTNIYAGRFVEPRLVATDLHGQDVAVAANADLFRFCFVEKNRIDAFSRIAARPPAQRTELIAALFGMESFNEFSNHFNESMDAELVTVAERQLTLRGKREALARDLETVKAEPAALLEHDAEDARFADAFRPGTTHAQLKEIIGNPETPGRVHEIDIVLNKVPPAVLGLTRQLLSDAYNAVDNAAQQLSGTTRKLADRGNQVSFRSLYTAIVALQATEGDKCPACETPLDRVGIDPYIRAQAGLAELRDLATLQEEQHHNQETLDDASRALHGYLSTMLRQLEHQGTSGSPIAAYIKGLPAHPRGYPWWLDVYGPQAGTDGAAPSLAQLLSLADDFAQTDITTRRLLSERDSLIEERNTLLRHQERIRDRALRRQILVEDAAAARLRIERFDLDNAQLIAQAEAEQKANKRDQPIKTAYDHFLPYLRRFRNQLPGMLMTGLNDVALQLYNEFNYQDHEYDKLAALHLPLTGDQRIEIAFRGTPERRLDALAVLSEGHVRCMGLAILLAKVLSLGAPFLVFDDAINAIDTEHRSGIRQTIFESDRFRDVQFIVTCHSGEFIKDVQNNLPTDSKQDWIEYVLRHHGGDHHPRVTPTGAPKGYVAKARAAYDLLNYRDTLAASRQALEMLANRIWKWMHDNEVGMIRVEVDRVGGVPTLNNLCSALRKKLNDSTTFVHPAKQSIIEFLGRILGIPAQNLIWTYLNKGTHEEADRDDFDAAHVETVVRAVEELGALDLRRARAQMPTT
jgi:recombinational DNA repair ATPase RecF